MTILISAFMLGLMGSFHCVGMCGPIAIALPVGKTSIPRIILGSSIYQFGKAITYSVMGFLFGWLGAGLSLGQYQQYIAIVMGLLMIAYGFAGLVFGGKVHVTIPVPFLSLLQAKMARLFSIQSNSALFTIGMLNGLLPCGLVYIALAGSMATANPFHGSAFMFFFGIGTLPILTVLTVTSNTISLGIRKKMHAFLPVMICIVGVFFLLRGLELGIPMISPKPNMKIVQKCDTPLDKQTPTCCKHKME